MNIKQQRTNKRAARGAALFEFAGAFAVLVVFFIMPLANLSFIASRFFITQGAVQEFAHRLALADKRSESYNTFSTDTWWSNLCNKCGVNVNGSQLELLICSSDGSQQIRVQNGQAVPAIWLPGGANSPCIYTFDLTVEISIPPVYNGGPSIPGLTTPIPVKLNGRSAWENLSRDPITTEYFINE